MATQSELDRTYMDCAVAMSRLSKAVRKKVGVIVVSPKCGIVADGVNGMPPGQSNECETLEDEQLVTKPECRHAELNAIAKLARNTNSSIGATIYCTLSPCLHCATLMLAVGILRVVYKEPYRDQSGVDFLTSSGIDVERLDPRMICIELEAQDEGRHDYFVDLWKGYENP